jgi:hypothetical protein
MTSEEFVIQLRTMVVDEAIVLYRDLFVNTSIDDATDPYWKRAIALFATLPSEQQKVFFEVMRQVAVDTTSTILGVLDGDCAAGEIRDLLLADEGGQRLNDDLQALFLGQEEKLVSSKNK